MIFCMDVQISYWLGLMVERKRIALWMSRIQVIQKSAANKLCQTVIAHGFTQHSFELTCLTGEDSK